MKKIKINRSSLLKSVFPLLVVGIYWYFVNNKLISETNQAFGLTSYFLLMCSATAFFPLPSNILALGATASASPLVVAIVGGLATIVAYLLEYLVFSLLFRHKKIATFKNSWLFKNIAPLFNKNKFFILAFFSFLPIPSEPLRIYAITSQYSRVNYLLAGFIGRTPRYFLLAYYGGGYVKSIPFLVTVMIFPVVLLFLLRAIVGFVGLIKAKYSSEAPVSGQVTATSSPVNEPENS